MCPLICASHKCPHLEYHRLSPVPGNAYFWLPKGQLDFSESGSHRNTVAETLGFWGGLWEEDQISIFLHISFRIEKPIPNLRPQITRRNVHMKKKISEYLSIQISKWSFLICQKEMSGSLGWGTMSSSNTSIGAGEIGYISKASAAAQLWWPEFGFPEPTCKKPAWQPASIILALEEGSGGQEDPWDSLARKAIWIGELQGQWEIPYQKLRGEERVIKKDSQCWHTCVHTYVHTHTRWGTGVGKGLKS